METFADTSALNKGEKHENKQNYNCSKSKIAKQNFLFNMHIHFPFGNI